MAVEMGRRAARAFRIAGSPALRGVGIARLATVPKTLLTGGAGLVGSQVARLLAQRGDELRLTVRRQTNLENLDFEYESVVCDILDRRAVRRALRGLGVTNVVVDTANRLQGREFDVTIMLHPLSGRRDATAFHLEAGRLCVLASRHRHACIVVARAGIPELLDAHPSAEPVHLGVPVKFPDGWEAHQAFMAHLARHRVCAV